MYHSSKCIMQINCKIIIICVFNLYIINKLQYHYLLQEYTEFTAKMVNHTIIIMLNCGIVCLSVHSTLSVIHYFHRIQCSMGNPTPATRAGLMKTLLLHVIIMI